MEYSYCGGGSSEIQDEAIPPEYPQELISFRNQSGSLGSGGWSAGCNVGTLNLSSKCASGGYNVYNCISGCTIQYLTGGCTTGYEAGNCTVGISYTGPGCATGTGVTGSTCDYGACCSGTTAIKTGACTNGTYASSCAAGGCPVACYSKYCTYS